MAQIDATKYEEERLRRAKAREREVSRVKVQV